MILLRIGVLAQMDSDPVITGNNNGWFFYNNLASGHLLTCGLI